MLSLLETCQYIVHWQHQLWIGLVVLVLAFFVVAFWDWLWLSDLCCSPPRICLLPIFGASYVPVLRIEAGHRIGGI